MRIWSRIPAWSGLVLLLQASCTAPIDRGAVEALADEVGEQDPLPYYLSRPALDAGAETALLEQLEEAVEDVREGEAPERAALAASILEDLAPIEDWSPLLRAEVHSRAADPAGTRQALGDLAPVPDLDSRWGRRILIDAHERAEDLDGAREVAVDGVRAGPEASVQARLWLQAGQLSLSAGDTAQTREDLWEALALGDRYSGARDAAALLDEIEGELDEERNLALGRALLAAGEWEEAVRRLESHLSGDRFASSEGDEVLAALGRGLAEIRRYAEATRVLAPLASADPPSDYTPAALFWTGRSAMARGAMDEARTAFRRIGEVDPGSSLAADGLTLLLERERSTGFGPRARALLDDLLSVSVTGVSAESLVTQLGADSYLAGEYEAAASVFERYRGAGRGTAARQQAAYWTALVRERAGDTPAAETVWAETHAEDPFSYYGLLAGERLAIPVIPADLGEGPDPVPGLELELRNALFRLKVLRILDIPGTVDFEVDRLSAHFHARGDGGYDFAEALIHDGFPLEGIALGWELFRREGEWNLRLLRIVYPFPYRDAVAREAQARGLDPHFVAGVIRQESLFHAPIMSSSGAVGLMQLMPPTAREVAGSLGIVYSPEVLTDPETNIRLGTTYLAQMTSRFGARPEAVLSAYNAGPGRTRQWQQIAAYRDPDVFLEHIPFPETRNYVRRVQQYARVYAALYSCAESVTCQ